MTETNTARVQELLDKAEIQECLVRFTRGIDRHDTDLARSAFHPDARDDHALFIGTGHELIDWANGYHDQAFRHHQHYLTNTWIELDGDQAHAESYMVLVAIGIADNVLSFGGGRYLDRLERRDGRWGIVDRMITVEWWNDPEALKTFGSLAQQAARDGSDPSYTRPLQVTRAPRDLTAMTT